MAGPSELVIEPAAWRVVKSESGAGSVCDSRRNPFVAQDTVIVESGGPLGQWRPVEIDLAEHFRHHFEHDIPARASLTSWASRS